VSDVPPDSRERHLESVESERLTGALLDRLTHHVHILEMNGDSYRLKQSKRRQRGTRSADTPENPSEG
jgi:DNA replication protein DnaC